MIKKYFVVLIICIVVALLIICLTISDEIRAQEMKKNSTNFKGAIKLNLTIEILPGERDDKKQKSNVEEEKKKILKLIEKLRRIVSREYRFSRF
jgi:hypothetical protein